MTNIRLSKSVVGIEEKNAVMQVLDEGFLGMGREVQLFENELQAFLKTRNEVICVNTGTSALHLALQAIGIGAGDEVLVPNITYVASFQAITATGATPVLVDVNLDTVFIDLEDAESRITKNTKAIMPVHYASDSQKMDDVHAFAKLHNLRVVEDAAHSFGSYRSGSLVGSECDVLCFSFDGIKNITAGEGGAIVTGDRKIIEYVRDARLLGVEKDTEARYQGIRSWDFDVKEQGWRYHMSNVMAAIGRAQLKKIEAFGSHRKQCAEHYLELMSGISNIEPLNLSYKENVPHIFPVKVLSNNRDELISYLREQKIECGVHYKPGSQLERYKSESHYPNSELLYKQLLTLPLHADLSRKEQDYVFAAIKKFNIGKL